MPSTKGTLSTSRGKTLGEMLMESLNEAVRDNEMNARWEDVANVLQKGSVMNLDELPDDLGICTAFDTLDETKMTMTVGEYIALRNHVNADMTALQEQLNTLSAQLDSADVRQNSVNFLLEEANRTIDELQDRNNKLFQENLTLQRTERDNIAYTNTGNILALTMDIVLKRDTTNLRKLEEIIRGESSYIQAIKQVRESLYPGIFVGLKEAKELVQTYLATVGYDADNAASRERYFRGESPDGWVLFERPAILSERNDAPLW